MGRVGHLSGRRDSIWYSTRPSMDRRTTEMEYSSVGKSEGGYQSRARYKRMNLQ